MTVIRVAILRRRDLAVVLLVRLPRGYEDHLIEGEDVRHLAAGYQVAMVNGVRRCRPSPRSAGARWPMTVSLTSRVSRWYRAPGPEIVPATSGRLRPPG